MTHEIRGGKILKAVKRKLAPYRKDCRDRQIVILQFKPPLKQKNLIALARYEAARFSTAHKIKTFQSLGCEVIELLLNPLLSVGTFQERLRTWTSDPKVAGIIVQYPMLARFKLGLLEIAAEKDLDGLLFQNPYFPVPAITEAIVRLVQSFAGELDTVAIVGAKGFVGKGVVTLLDQANIKILELDAGDDLERTREATIVVSATGVPDLLNERHIIPAHRLVIDAGFVPMEGYPIRGDVNRSVYDIPQNLTPVPGGVGPLQMATLLERLVSRISDTDIVPWAFNPPSK